MDKTKFERVVYDHEAEMYRDENGEAVSFAKLVCIRFEGEIATQKLSWTREVDGIPTDKAVPCLKGSGEKTMLDHPGIEIASDCLIKG